MEFIGFENYVEVFEDSSVMAALKHNLIYTAVTVPSGIVLGVIIAALLNEKIFMRGFIRGMIFLPFVTNTVAVSVVFLVLYHPTLGPINVFLNAIGFDNPPAWLSNPKTALWAVMLMSIWKSLGYNVVIFLAGLQGIPKSLYEAAKIDGASIVSRFIHITIPMLSPTTFFLVITGVIGSFKVFAEVNVMTGGGPGRSTTVLVHEIYKHGFIHYDGGYASAIAWIFFAIILVITLINWYGQKKWVHY